MVNYRIHLHDLVTDEGIVQQLKMSVRCVNLNLCAKNSTTNIKSESTSSKIIVDFENNKKLPSTVNRLPHFVTKNHLNCY